MGLRRSREPQQTTRCGRKTPRIEQIVPGKATRKAAPLMVWVVDHLSLSARNASAAADADTAFRTITCPRINGSNGHHNITQFLNGSRA